MSFSDAPSDMETMAPEGAPVELASAAAGQRREKRDTNNPLQPCSVKQLLECQFDAFTHRFTLKGGKPLTHVEFIGVATQFEEQPSSNTLSMRVEDGSGAIVATKQCEALASEAERISSKLGPLKSNYVRVIGKLMETRHNPFQPQEHLISAFSIEPVEDHNIITWMNARVCRALVEQETGITRVNWERNKSGIMPNIPGPQQQQLAPPPPPQVQQQPQVIPGNFGMRGGQQPPQAPMQHFAQTYATPPHYPPQQPQQYAQGQAFTPAVQQQLVRPMTQMQMQPQGAPAGFGGQQGYPQQGYAQQQVAYQTPQPQQQQQQPVVATNPREQQMWQFFQQLAIQPQCKEIGVDIRQVAAKFSVTAADAEKFFLERADAGQCYTTIDTMHYMPS